MSITRTAIVDDDGTGTTGTVLSNAWKQELYNQIDASSSLTLLPTDVGVQNNYAPGISGTTILRINNASLLTITGIAGGVAGQRVLIQSVNASGQIDLTHQDAGSLAANRFQNFASSGKTSLAGGIGAAEYVYDLAGYWRLINHEQGGWLTPAYAAGTFTGGGSQTWTVDAGDVTSFAYRLSGRTLSLSVYLVTTSVGGTPNVDLKIAMPTGFLAARTFFLPGLMVSDNGGANVQGVWHPTAGSNLIGLYRDLTAASNWTAATNTTAIYGLFTVDVQ